jgi:hypothetical protein
MTQRAELNGEIILKADSFLRGVTEENNHNFKQGNWKLV